MQTLLKSTQAYRLLKTETQENRLSHAYLLLMNDARNLRVALKTFAKLFFRCDDADVLSPSQRRISDLIDADNFSDCLFFPTEGKKLTVEDAERIQEESLLSPVETEQKLFILGDFSEANAQTQNKLLKLLEEPPKGVLFLLGATSVFPVLQTVLSRTKKLEILPFDVAEVTSCLRRIYGNKFDDSTLTLCAAAAGGIVGEAQRIAEGGQYRALLEQAVALASCTQSRLPTLSREAGEHKNPKELLSLLRVIYRDLLLIKLSQPAKNLMLRFEYAALKHVAEKYSESALLYAQEALSDAEKEAQFNAVFPQCIELCMAKILKRNESSF